MKCCEHKIIDVASIFSLIVIVVSTFSLQLNTKPSANQGRHFMVAFMQNEIDRSDIDGSSFASIFISAIQSDTVTIAVPGKNPTTVILSANQVYEVGNQSNLEVRNIGKNVNKLIDIRSKHPIVV